MSHKVKHRAMKCTEKIKTRSGVFEIECELGAGSFGIVHKVRHLASGKHFAMKTESIHSKTKLLSMEVRVLKAVTQSNGRHFCQIFARGHHDDYNFVIMTLVGPSLNELRRRFGSNGRRFRASTAVRSAEQTLEAIEDLHKTGYLHRDIKAANYTIGLPGTHDQVKIYLLDFGMCRQYRNSETGQIRLPRSVANFRGTARYASLNSHDYKDMSRKDDMETWLYMTIELTSGRLPWKDQTDKAVIRDMKKDARTPAGSHKLFWDCPNEYALLLEYFDKIEFWEEPDYSFCYKMLRRIMKKHQPTILDTDLFDWQPSKPKKSTKHNKTTNKRTMITQNTDEKQSPSPSPSPTTTN